MSKARQNLLRLAVSAATLIYLLWQVDLSETATALRRVDLTLLGAAIGFYIAGLIMRAYRWFVLVHSLDPSVSFTRLLRLYFVGQFFSTFLPSSFGGDVVRALEMTQHTDPAAAVGTVFLDRMIGLLVLFVAGLVAMPSQAAGMGWELSLVMAALMIGGLVVGGLVLEGRILHRIGRRLPGALSLAGEGRLARIYSAVTGCGKRAVTKAGVLSAVFVVVNIVIFWLCAEALNLGLGPLYLAAVVPLIAVSGLIPSLGGWGVREMVTTVVLAPAGIPASRATALGVTLGLVPMVAGLPGGIMYSVGALRGLLARRNKSDPLTKVQGEESIDHTADSGESA